MTEIEKKLRETIKTQGKSRSTADSYWNWWKRYSDFCKLKKFGKETKAEIAVEKFLTDLANNQHVSANTQNQAFSALCYMYKHVRGRELTGISALRSKRPDRVRDVCDESEVAAICEHLNGIYLLAVRLMYGFGLRISEVLNLRIKDLDFNRKQIHVWDSKGKKDRVAQFSESIHDDVRRQIESVKVLWRADIADGLSGVPLPNAFGKKSPSSHTSLAWYWLFPADHYSRNPDDGKLYRFHRDKSGISKKLKEALQKSGVTKRITSHCMRHTWATSLAESGVPSVVVQKLAGHANLETTETYFHVRKDGITATKSPLENILSNPVPRPKPQAEPQPATLKLFVG